jgi:hypothetical protein
MDKIHIDAHKEAMNLASEAFVLRIQGQVDLANSLTLKAFKKERQAALSVLNETDLEPTRSVLFRSAASLAIECFEFREAEKLICAGLYGNPPDEIAEELRDLLETVNFSRHLHLKNIDITCNEFQLSLTGNSVGLGVAKASEYLPRIDKIETLIYRTEERRREINFRNSGAPSKIIRDNLELFISTPRAASFAVTLRLGFNTSLPLQGAGLADEIIDDIFLSLRLFNNSDFEALKHHIPDKDYFQNFIGIAKMIAPDGEKVKTVNLTSLRSGIEESISMSTPRSNTLKINENYQTLKNNGETSMGENIKVIGRLKLADSVKKNGKLLIVDDTTDEEYSVRVPKAIMSDIVKPLWEEKVVLEGVKKKKYIDFTDIYPFVND